jgi:pyruvate,water dikinase
LIKLFSKDFTSKEVIGHSQKIQDLLLKSKIPEHIIKKIKLAFEKFCEEIGKSTSFAVRSSATIEDLIKFSFAGQYETYLYNKSLENILNSLKNCWISMFSPQALLYYLQMITNGLNMSLSNIHMAVVVQKMVNSQISGVLFTANVINNNKNQMMINSTWGLGETITNNSVNPDTIVLNKKKFEILKIIVGRKEKMSIKNPKGSSTILIDSEPQSRTICSLKEKQLLDLYELGLKLENAFGSPQDIEWAIENDTMYALQSRPITTLKTK